MAWTLGTVLALNKMRLGLYILGFLVLSFAATGTAAPKGRLPVISIESNVFSKEELVKIQKALGLNLNEPIDLRILDKGLKELHQTGTYQSLAVETENTAVGVKIYILGSKIRYIRKVNFINIDSEVIEAARKGQELEEGRVADLGKFSALRERMKQEYEARGYYFAEIQVMITDIPGTREVDVEIEGKAGNPTRVSKVSITGATKKEIEEIREIIPFKKGSVFTKESAEKASQNLNQYFRENRYPTARIEESGFSFSEDKMSVDVSYQLKLGERYQFTFHGNTVFDEVELKELMTAEVLSQSDSTVRIKELIEEKYKGVGYHFAKVNVTKTESANDKMHLVRFDIDEGNRVIIDKVSFNGGEEVGHSQLGKYYFEDAPGVIARHRYWEAGVPEAGARMTKKLELQGYLKAQVLGPRAVFSEDKKGVELFYDVELGNRTYISDINVVGNRHFDRDRLKEILPFHIGDAVNTEKLEEGRRALLTFYQNEGFADVKLEETDAVKMLLVSSDQRQATISFHITEGTQYFIGNITLDGNRRTEPKVVLREVLLKSGDKFNPELVRMSEENIALLGLFSRVEVVSAPSPDKPATKDLRIVVAEIKPGVGEVGLGGAYEEPRFRLRTFLGLAYRNVLGLNQTASLRTEVAIPISHEKDVIPFVEYSAVLGYRAPYPFELPFTFSTQVGLDSYEVATLAGNVPEVQTRARIEEKIEKKLSSKVTGIYRLHRYERTTTEILDDKTPKSTDSIGSTGPGLIVDLRNDSFNPTSGSYHILDLEFAHPAILSQDNISFMMAISRNSFYFPLFDPFSFIFHLGGGYGHSFFASPLPVARLTSDLSLGGLSSLRGYSPKEYQPVDNSNPSNNPRDTAYINARAELIAALFENVSGAVFFDTGELFPRWIPAGRKDGVGFGFRYKTPVGPIVIDIGYGFQSKDRNVKFSFTIGTI